MPSSATESLANAGAAESASAAVRTDAQHGSPLGKNADDDPSRFNVAFQSPSACSRGLRTCHGCLDTDVAIGQEFAHAQASRHRHRRRQSRPYDRSGHQRPEPRRRTVYPRQGREKERPRRTAPPDLRPFRHQPELAPGRIRRAGARRAGALLPLDRRRLARGDRRHLRSA